jgi:hypothetical protein
VDRYDLHLQVMDPSVQAWGAVFTLNSGNIIAVKGRWKLLDRFLKVLFTPKGSSPLRRKEGTLFPFVFGGNITDVGSLEAGLHDYVDDAAAQIMEYDRRAPWLTPDERLQSAQVGGFRQFDATRFEFVLDVQSVSGRRMPVPLPVALR